MIAISDTQQIARDKIAERIHDAEQYAKLRQRGRPGRSPSPGPRHRIATALHRLADRVEPRRRPALSISHR